MLYTPRAPPAHATLHVARHHPGCLCLCSLEVQRTDSRRSTAHAVQVQSYEAVRQYKQQKQCQQKFARARARVGLLASCALKAPSFVLFAHQWQLRANTPEQVDCVITSATHSHTPSPLAYSTSQPLGGHSMEALKQRVLRNTHQHAPCALHAPACTARLNGMRQARQPPSLRADRCCSISVHRLCQLIQLCQHFSK